jgi:hypothetical protein
MPAFAFDPDKDRANLVKHGVSLARASELRMLAVQLDARFDYPEPRFRAWGPLDGLPHCLAFAVIDERLRAISLRRAHLKEYRRYVPED